MPSVDTSDNKITSESVSSQDKESLVATSLKLKAMYSPSATRQVTLYHWNDKPWVTWFQEQRIDFNSNGSESFTLFYVPGRGCREEDGALKIAEGMGNLSEKEARIPLNTTVLENCLRSIRENLDRPYSLQLLIGERRAIGVSGNYLGEDYLGRICYGVRLMLGLQRHPDSANVRSIVSQQQSSPVHDPTAQQTNALFRRILEAFSTGSLDSLVSIVNDDAAVQTNLGNRYYKGDGVEQNHSKALELYQKAANQGYAEAQYKLGICYFNGEGMQQSYEEAIDWFKKAAEQEHAAAQKRLGDCYYTGQGVEQNYCSAVEWYQKAANQGNPAAQCALGFCYENEKGVKQDLSTAAEWYQIAAFQGDAEAQCRLGVCYEKGNGVHWSYIKAIERYQKAAEQGYAKGQCILGGCYENKWGVELNYAKAAELYQKAAEQGYAEAQYLLGRLYEDGKSYYREERRNRYYEEKKSVQKDDSKAIMWYQKAAGQGYADAQCRLALSYEEGKGVQKDYSSAMMWYQKAADQKCSEAQYKIGFYYENEQGVPRDYAKAAEWYQKAAE